MTTVRFQFSLAALMLVCLVAVPMGLGLGIPAYHAARSIEWGDPTIGVMLGWFGLLAAIAIAIYYVRR